MGFDLAIKRYDKRYVDTYLAGKDKIVVRDVYNTLEHSMIIDIDIFTLYLIEKKKLTFSYKLISVSNWGNYLDAFLLGNKIISIRFRYSEFLEFQRNIKIEKILSI